MSQDSMVVARPAPGRARQVPQEWARSGRLAVAALALFGLALSAAAVLVAARRTGQDSDTVQSLLAARSILDGNLLLSGWHMATDNFLFTDTLPFLVLAPLAGFTAVWLYPLIVHVLILAAGLAACLRWRRPAWQGLIGAATLLLLLGAPPLGRELPILHPDEHGASILFALLALLALARAAGSDGRWPAALAMGLLAWAAVASDPFTLIFAFGPALLVLGLEILGRDAGRRMIGLTLLLAAACLAGMLTPRAIRHLGGFLTEPTVSMAFVAPGHFGRAIQGVFYGLLYASGSDVFGKPVLVPGTLAAGARLIGWLLGGAAVLAQGRRLLRAGGGGLLDRMLLAGWIALVLSCFGTEMFDRTLEGALFGGGARYLSPCLVFGAVLAARAMPSAVAMLPTRRFRVAITALVAVLAGGLLAGHAVAAKRLAALPGWRQANPSAEVARWLAAQGLRCGVGEYWSASILTALTGAQVTVRAVSGPPEGPLRPFLWLADDRWFSGLTPGFVVWTDPPLAPFHVNEQTVTATYGPPTRVERVGRYKVAVLPTAGAGCTTR